MYLLDYATVKNMFEKHLEHVTPKSYTQKKMFQEIWEERNHISEISGKPLFYPQHPQWHWQFLHVLGKGPYPSMKLFKPNIILGTVKEHEHQEEYDVFNEAKDVLKRVYNEVLYS